MIELIGIFCTVFIQFCTDNNVLCLLAAVFEFYGTVNGITYQFFSDRPLSFKLLLIILQKIYIFSITLSAADKT